MPKAFYHTLFSDEAKVATAINQLIGFDGAQVQQEDLSPLCKLKFRYFSSNGKKYDLLSTNSRCAFIINHTKREGDGLTQFLYAEDAKKAFTDADIDAYLSALGALEIQKLSRAEKIEKMYTLHQEIYNLSCNLEYSTPNTEQKKKAKPVRFSSNAEKREFEKDETSDEDIDFRLSKIQSQFLRYLENLVVAAHKGIIDDAVHNRIRWGEPTTMAALRAIFVRKIDEMAQFAQAHWTLEKLILEAEDNITDIEKIKICAEKVNMSVGNGTSVDVDNFIDALVTRQETLFDHHYAIKERYTTIFPELDEIDDFSIEALSALKKKVLTDAKDAMGYNSGLDLLFAITCNIRKRHEGPTEENEPKRRKPN